MITYAKHIKVDHHIVDTC